MKRRKYGAFTLFELLISLSIWSVIAALSYTSFVSVRKITEINRKNEEVLRNIRWFLNRLDVEISSAVYVKRAEQTIFLSNRMDFDGKKINNLVFTTILPQTYLEIGKREEIIRVEYEVKQNEEDSDLLVITKKIFFHTLSPETIQEPVEFIIRDDFTSFMLRFYKKGKWYESWDTKKMGLLPEGIELIFSLGGKKYREFFNVYISEI